MNDIGIGNRHRPATGGSHPPARAAGAARTDGRRSAPVWGAAACVLLLPLTAPAQALEVPFQSSYRGTFTIAFGAAPNGTDDDLRFAGGGIASQLGQSAVDGHSTTRPSQDDPLCSDIITDAVTLTAANGDELWLTNSGEDCLDLSALPRLFIRGSGTFVVTGGTGRFQGATGSGTFAVVAEVLESVPGGVAGVFELRFEGRVSPPGD